MYHNLEWIGDLEIEYDLFTFDTDPFEPQPDRMETILLFWVQANGSAKGYLEMIYTLVQNFTLNKNNDIWGKKVAWIAQNGGMVLVNVHPDYVNFSQNKNVFN